MLGADPEELRGLGTQMNTAAQRLGEIRGGLESALSRFLWQGGDAAQFQDQWVGRWAGLFDAAVSAVGAAAKSLIANAEQQEQASAGTGAAAGGSLSGPSGSGPGGTSVFDLIDTLGTATAIEGLSVGAGALVQDAAKIHDPSITDIVDLDDVGTGLGVAGLGIDAVTLVHGLVEDPHSPDTYDSEVGTVIDATALAAGIACPPLGFAIGLGGFVYDSYLDKRLPNLSKDIVDGVGAAATSVGKAAADGVETDLDAAGAVGTVVSSGVHGILSHIHF
jgi:hypothetical protein